ncbi:hypothetical protein OQA88_2612 [Cercophora sp. LCS_1]
MSGIEIAGLISGAFPIVYEFGKELKQVLDSVHFWWAFEAKFEDFIFAVKTEHVVFAQNIKFLLDELDIPEEYRDALENNQRQDLWHDTSVQTELRRLLGNQYLWYMQHLMDINKAIREVQTLLPIGKVHLMRPASLQAELWRVRRSFSGRGQRLLECIRSRNEAMGSFLDRASRMPLSPKSKAPTATNPQVQALLTVRGKMTHIDTHLTQRQCRCRGPHQCGIIIRWEMKPTISILFADTPARRQINLEAETVGKEKDQLPITTVQAPGEEVGQLLHEMTLKEKWRELKGFGHSILKLVALSSSVGSSISIPSAVPRFTGPEAQPQAGSERKRFALLQAPNHKDLEAESSTTTRAVITSYVAKEATSTANTQHHTSNNRSTLSSPVLSRSNSYTSHSARRVRFAVPDTGSLGGCRVDRRKEHKRDDLSRTKNMCQCICSSRKAASGQFIEVDQQTRLVLQLDSTIPGDLDSYEMQPLQDFITATADRGARLRIGCTLAKTVLALGGSIWLPLTWDKTNIAFLRCGHDPGLDFSGQQSQYGPYILQPSLQTLGESSAPETERAKANMFALGILLLELLFQEMFEKQEVPSGFLGPDGRPNKTTNYCVALVWQRRVRDFFGFPLADAIRRCLVCDFPGLEPGKHQNNQEFVRAVRDRVISPFEDFLRAWETPMDN